MPGIIQCRKFPTHTRYKPPALLSKSGAAHYQRTNPHQPDHGRWHLGGAFHLIPPRHAKTTDFPRTKDINHPHFGPIQKQQALPKNKPSLARPRWVTPWRCLSSHSTPPRKNHRFFQVQKLKIAPSHKISCISTSLANPYSVFFFPVLDILIFIGSSLSHLAAITVMIPFTFQS